MKRVLIIKIITADVFKYFYIVCDVYFSVMKNVYGLF